MRRSPENSLVLASVPLLVCAAAALAGKVESLSFKEEADSKPTIDVKSVDGLSYQSVESGPLDFKVHVWGGCNYASAERNLKITIGQTTQNLNDFWYGIKKGYGTNRGYTITTPYASPNIGQSPVQACNLLVQELVAQGTPAWRVLQQGTTITKEGAYLAKATLTCGSVVQDSETKSAPLRVVIRCLPSPLAKGPTPTPTPTVTPKPAHRVEAVGGKVSSVSLTVDPTNYKGTCPTNVKFHAHIVPAEPIKLGWMIEGDGNYRSPEYALDITTGTPKNPSTFRTIERPSTMGQLTIGGPAKLPLIQGWAQLRVWDTEKPGTGSLRSAKVSFIVDCNPPSPAVGGSLVIAPTPTPKGLSAQPSPRQP